MPSQQSSESSKSITFKRVNLGFDLFVFVNAVSFVWKLPRKLSILSILFDFFVVCVIFKSMQTTSPLTCRCCELSSSGEQDLLV